jgi:hypothetical protein
MGGVGMKVVLGARKSDHRTKRTSQGPGSMEWYDTNLGHCEIRQYHALYHTVNSKGAVEIPSAVWYANTKYEQRRYYCTIARPL